MTDTRDKLVRSTAGPARRGWLLALGVVVAACAGDDPAQAGDTIDRELFIATYVDLRAAALESEARVLTDEARDEVLARHDVTEEALMTFAEVHGRDVELMSEVWNEVELRLDAMRPGGEPR